MTKQLHRALNLNNHVAMVALKSARCEYAKNSFKWHPAAGLLLSADGFRDSFPLSTASRFPHLSTVTIYILLWPTLATSQENSVLTVKQSLF